MSRQARLGLIIATATLLFAVMLFLLARRSTIFGDTFLLTAEFGHVGGLRAGAPVEYRGIPIGTVETVALPDTPQGPISVHMLVRTEARSLLRADSRARIVSDGVLGNQMVIIGAGSEAAEPLGERPTLTGEDPLDIMEAAGMAVESVALVDSVLLGLHAVLQDLESGKGTLGLLLQDPSAYQAALRTAGSAQQVLVETQETVTSLAARVDSSLDGLDQLVALASSGDGTVARLLNDSTLYAEILATSDEIDDLLSHIDGLASDAEIAADWGILTLHRAAETMAALRRHWLFRRYFRDEEREPVDETFRVLEQQRQILREREAALRADSTASNEHP